MTTYKDFPLETCARKARRILKERPDAKIYQKFTCTGCGNRLTMEMANQFFETGSCDNCDTLTDIRKHGCNYLVHFGHGGL